MEKKCGAQMRLKHFEKWAQGASSDSGKDVWGSDESRKYSGNRIRVAIAVFIEMQCMPLLLEKPVWQRA